MTRRPQRAADRELASRSELWRGTEKLSVVHHPPPENVGDGRVDHNLVGRLAAWVDLGKPYPRGRAGGQNPDAA
jgi:hypothetical protein